MLCARRSHAVPPRWPRLRASARPPPPPLPLPPRRPRHLWRGTVRASAAAHGRGRAPAARGSSRRVPGARRRPHRTVVQPAGHLVAEAHRGVWQKARRVSGLGHRENRTLGSNPTDGAGGCRFQKSRPASVRRFALRVLLYVSPAGSSMSHTSASDVRERGREFGRRPGQGRRGRPQVPQLGDRVGVQGGRHGRPSLGSRPQLLLLLPLLLRTKSIVSNNATFKVMHRP